MANIPFVDDQEPISLRTDGDGPLSHSSAAFSADIEACNYRSFEFIINFDKNGDVVPELNFWVQHFVEGLGYTQLSKSLFVLTGFSTCSGADFSFVGDDLVVDTTGWATSGRFSLEVPALGSTMRIAALAPAASTPPNQWCQISLVRRAKG